MESRAAFDALKACLATVVETRGGDHRTVTEKYVWPRAQNEPEAWVVGRLDDLSDALGAAGEGPLFTKAPVGGLRCEVGSLLGSSPSAGILRARPF